MQYRDPDEFHAELAVDIIKTAKERLPYTSVRNRSARAFFHDGLGGSSDSGGLMRRTIFLLLAVLATACASPFTPSSSVADVVRLQGVLYLHCPAPTCAVTDIETEAQYDTVVRRISAELAETDYRLKDGEATVLDAGTPLYRIREHTPQQRLAARQRGEWRVYRAGEL